MGVDTIGIVKTDEKDVFAVLDRLSECISFGYFADVKLYKNQNITVDFSDDQQERMLTVKFDYDYDYSEIEYGSKLILSLRAWGNSTGIMMGLLQEFASDQMCNGWVYLCPDDSKDKWYRFDGETWERYEAVSDE